MRDGAKLQVGAPDRERRDPLLIMDERWDCDLLRAKALPEAAINSLFLSLIGKTAT